MSSNTANTTGVIGASGTGKGQYVKGRLMTGRPAKLTLVWSLLEETDRYHQVLGGELVSTVPAMVDVIRAGARVVVYQPGPGAPIDKQFDLFCRIAWARPGARVVVEELSRVTKPSWAPEWWRNLSTAGRHRGIELIATAQRPAMIDKHFIGNCTEVRCFRCTYETDAREMARMMAVPFAQLQQLPDLDYVHRDIRKRINTTGRQTIFSKGRAPKPR